MTTVSISYGSATALTMTLASLATDANLVAGRESTAIDNTSDLFVDALVFGSTMTGTTPTAARQIEVWLYGSLDGTNYSGSATGSDANLTPGEKTLLKLLTIIPTVNTSNKAYIWGPYSVSQAFGLMVPYYGVYQVHNTGANLNATGGNHFVKYRGGKYVSA